MPSTLDLVCVECQSLERDHFFAQAVDTDSPPPCQCGGRREISWSARWHRTAAWHEHDRIVLFRSPQGEPVYPGRNDLDMPERYRRAGYQREEITSLPQYNSFEKENGVYSEAMHFDRNGKTDREDQIVPMPDSKYSNLLD